jgi:hypothetical protein
MYQQVAEWKTQIETQLQDAHQFADDLAASLADARFEAFKLEGEEASDAADAIAEMESAVLRADAKAAIIDARRRITIAADYNRTEEIGTAYIRLHDLYKRSLNVQDVKTALAAQKELNKLLDLYTALRAGELEEATEGEMGERGIAAAELAAVREHLLPLELAPEDYPIAEHARIAADLIRKRHDPAA